MKILVVEDNEAQRKVVEFNMSRYGYSVMGAGTIGDGIRLMREFAPDAVITDVMLPDGNGIDLLERLLSINPELIVIVVTAYGTIRMAVDAIKKGAYDYLTKPYEKEELLLSVRRAVQGRGTERQRSSIIGVSAAIEGVKDMIGRVAGADVPVLITGESGTGKEVVARAVHDAGGRADGRFVAVNCAAIPSSLLEAELFGYKKGAFTGAATDKPGKMALADRGTLFLDEIGSMDVALQPKLLRVLETGYVESLGDTEGRRVDVRVISATNADLASLMRQGAFREDLYYRLNVVHIHLTPLRERREDIPPLVGHFIGRYAPGGGLTVNADAMDRIAGHPWYGNVRELENFIRRTVVMKGGGVITDTDVEQNLPQPMPLRGQDVQRADESMDDAERRLIVSALGKADYNISKAAKLLKTPRHKLVYRMKKYGIDARGTE